MTSDPVTATCEWNEDFTYSKVISSEFKCPCKHRKITNFDPYSVSWITISGTHCTNPPTPPDESGMIIDGWDGEPITIGSVINKSILTSLY